MRLEHHLVGGYVRYISPYIIIIIISLRTPAHPYARSQCVDPYILYIVYNVHTHFILLYWHNSHGDQCYSCIVLCCVGSNRVKAKVL